MNARRLSVVRGLAPQAGRRLSPVWNKFLASISQEVKENTLDTNGEDYQDVVIVGGGMVGAAVCCSLAKNPFTSSLRVTIVDGSAAFLQDSSASNSAVPDARVSAITPSTVHFLKDVGAWETVRESQLAPFDSMQVWDYTGQGFTRYCAADVGRDVLGYVVENNVLVTALRSVVQHSGSSEIICPSQVQRVQFLPKKGSVGVENLAKVWLEDGRLLRTRLVVGADGARSRVRSMAGLETTGWNYNQQAIICTVQVGCEHSTAWQRFLPTGPLALLPMGGDFSNIVWSTTPEKAKELKSMTNDEFVKAANQALTEDYGALPKSQFDDSLLRRFVSPFLGDSAVSVTQPFEIPPPVTACLTQRLSFPLSLAHSKRYIAPRLALVGDAAHTVHPLAGQGVNLGFGDAVSLVKVLGEGIQSGSDVGEVAVLEKYEQERFTANVPMMAIVDALHRIFALDFLPMKMARKMGFDFVQYFGPLKKQIIKFAIGGTM